MRSGCVNIHLKGNTQGRTREGGCSVLLSVASCLIWRKESLERRVAARRGLMEIKKRADLMWKHTGLDQAEKWEGNGKSEGMLAKIYGWKQKKIWIDEMSGREKGKKRKIERMSWKKGQQEEETEEIRRDEMNTIWVLVKKTGLVEWGRKGGAEVIFSVIIERNGWIQLFNGKCACAM